MNMQVLTSITAGLESEVSLVRLEDGQTVILKRPKPTRRPNYILEADAYRKLLALGARVPEVLHADEEVLVLSVMPGMQLDGQQDLYTVRLFSDIARDLALLRQVTYDGFGPMDMDAYRKTGEIRGRFNTWSQFLVQAGEMLAHLHESQYLEPRTVQKLQAYWSTHLAAATNLQQGHLVHGDFAMSAIFVKDGQYSGLIDFGDALIGDPLMDLAYFKFKEINKSYGDATYTNLATPYHQYAGYKTPEHYTERTNLYMIYWGALRVLNCPDAALKHRFADKLKAVAAGLHASHQRHAPSSPTNA